MAETQKEKIMRLLDCTEAEAEDVIETDKAIDRGERVYFDLDKDAEKEAKKMINLVRQKGGTMAKTKKENPTKGSIISELAQFLTENSENACENIEITNKERQIAFKIGEENYELTLIQKRKPKN